VVWGVGSCLIAVWCRGGDPRDQVLPGCVYSEKGTPEQVVDIGNREMILKPTLPLSRSRLAFREIVATPGDKRCATS
jgi:hypothetical protein